MKRLNVAVVAIALMSVVWTMGAAANTTLTWYVWGPDAYVDVYHEMAKMYSDQTPDVTVEVHRYAGSAPEQLATLLAGGVVPDLTTTNNVNMAALMTQGVFADLDEFAARDPGFSWDWFFPTTVESVTHNGHHWAMPSHFGTVEIFYNMQMFEERGVAAPTGQFDWDAFFDIARRLTVDSSGDGNPDVFGSGLGNNPQRTFHWFWQRGAEIFNESGTESLWDQTEAVEVFDFLSDSRMPG